MADSVLTLLKDDDYRIGPLQAVVYNRQHEKVFPEGYLGKLFFRLKGSQYSKKRPDSNGILEMLFCGVTDLSFDNIVAYMAKIPLVIVGEWDDEGETFTEAGVGFPTAITGPQGSDQRSCFMGYGFFPEYWGKADHLTVMGMLGLAAIFQELNVTAIHGLRYSQNNLTARFTRQFGFRDNGVIPYYMMRRAKLVDAVCSTLLRSDFVSYCSQELLKAHHAQHEAAPEPAKHPLHAILSIGEP